MSQKDQASTPKNQYWKDPKPPYTMIGSGQATKMFPTGTIDTLAVIGSLNKSQLEIFLYFRNRISINYQLDKKYPNASRNLNEVNLALDTDHTKLIKALMQRNNNIKALVDKQILKKGKKKCYMVNPFILIPNREFKRHAATWLYYNLIDTTNDITLDQVLISMDQSLDDSLQYMDMDFSQ
ncbi:MAG: hypothetical protein GY861_19230 [bacterium]|nr:hypothetical protein [bacterium]